MRINRFTTTALGGVFLLGVSQSAFAGCFGPSAQCNPGVNVYPSSADLNPAVDVYSSNPYGYLETSAYKNTPNVNITRVYGQRPTVALGDFPSKYSGGCKPGSTMYCRAPQAMPVNVQMAPPPMISAPTVVPAAPRITVGSGYNPANFAPRQYGRNDLVPGIAHIPTSIVDRSPVTHIDGVPQPQVRSVRTAAMAGASYGMRLPMPAPITGRPVGGNVLGHVNAGSYTYQAPGGGAYWEKTSGPTMVDGLPATQILCRRQAPRPAPISVNVVRPVVGIPYAVPTPVTVRTGCTPAPRPVAGVPVVGKRRYGSGWTY